MVDFFDCFFQLFSWENHVASAAFADNPHVGTHTENAENRCAAGMLFLQLKSVPHGNFRDVHGSLLKTRSCMVRAAVQSRSVFKQDLKFLPYYITHGGICKGIGGNICFFRAFKKPHGLTTRLCYVFLRIFRMLSLQRQYFSLSSGMVTPDSNSVRMARFRRSSSARVPVDPPHAARPTARGM